MNIFGSRLREDKTALSSIINVYILLNVLSNDLTIRMVDFYSDLLEDFGATELK